MNPLELENSTRKQGNPPSTLSRLIFMSMLVNGLHPITLDLAPWVVRKKDKE
ncbi:hypothetical protein COLO4_02646 [Corchorus olitorius]|uniref:Uncharacterized protein n=1 Tax=Corchorus olitorius TaxID=93759 RepID=A0A1R3L0K2_9ROSI|nr:hypothetical protein COLO4_03241 [Corchorus olitorius]OMP12876.1 hypothetical protein COLO4_02646 [Corchorus olitorius]